MAASDSLRVSTDFLGGSAEVLAADGDQTAVAPACHPGRGWPAWWYFQVDGARPGTRLSVRVHPIRRPFSGSRGLTGRWALLDRAAISADDVRWGTTPPGRLESNGIVYEVEAPAARFWMAWGPPFLPSHAEAAISGAVARCADADRFVLATSREGRPVVGVRLGARGACPAVWVHARQHAWEAG